MPVSRTCITIATDPFKSDHILLGLSINDVTIIKGATTGGKWYFDTLRPTLGSEENVWSTKIVVF